MGFLHTMTSHNSMDPIQGANTPVVLRYILLILLYLLDRFGRWREWIEKR